MFALSLSGGGLRGAVHAGFLSVLNDENIQPDLITGSSAGSIVAALFASGIEPIRIQSAISNQMEPSFKVDWRLLYLPFSILRKLLGNFFGLPMGLLSADKLEWLLGNLVIGSFESLDPPIAVVTCSIADGNSVVFTSLKPKTEQPKVEFTNKSSVAAAVTASSCIPGIFAPRTINGKMLVDGGVVNNCPADIARMLGATKVIAIDLGFSLQEDRTPVNGVEVLLQAVDIMGQKNSNLITKEYADLTLTPETGAVNLTDLTEIPRLYTAGQKLARENLRAIKELIEGKDPATK